MNDITNKNEILTTIKDLIDHNQVVLFMKGNKDFPNCGYSSLVVRILSKLGVDFKDVNVLENESIRHAIKEYTNWPTIPQLYVKGEFIGGADIVHQLHEDGELMRLFKEKQIEVSQSLDTDGNDTTQSA